AAQTQVAVADREQRLGGTELVDRRWAHLHQPPLVDGESGAIHRIVHRRRHVGRSELVHTSSWRSCTTTSAPCSVNAVAPAPRSTPTTSPKRPARPAAT